VFQAKVSEDKKLGLHVGKFMTEETAWDSMLSRSAVKERSEHRAVYPPLSPNIRSLFRTRTRSPHFCYVFPFKPLKTSRLLLEKYLTNFHDVASAGL
jgi:hypothetical protein